MNVNYADDARQLTDGELSAVLKVYADEQQRRDFKKRHGDANPLAVEIAKRHHERLYGCTGALGTF